MHRSHHRHLDISFNIIPIDFRMGFGIPSISISSDCAISSRLSPFATSKVCSSPSLSMNVTLSLYRHEVSHLYS